MILGIDEVGRGSWAGPLVVGAVVLGGKKIEGLTDSKLLSRKRREELDVIIRSTTKGIGLGWVSAKEIDEIGLSASLKLATIRAVEQVNVFYDEIIIDGTVNFLDGTVKGKYVKTLKKADLLIPSVSAASIVAKVARDNYMITQDDIYPGYGFKSHVGYGTSAHSNAIEKQGVTPLHRLSFAPMTKYCPVKAGPAAEFAPDFRSITNAKSGAAPLGITRLAKRLLSHSVLSITDPIRERDRNDDHTTTKDIGDSGEDVASKYLEDNGHTIIDRNWKTKLCEIDIISKKDEVIYFTEVKYRKNSKHGGGIEAITKKKLRQMKFAVELYALNNKLSNTSFRLAVVSVTGQPPNFESYLEVD